MCSGSVTGVEFGERAFYKKRNYDHNENHLEARWLPGTWLGKRWGTQTHIL